MINETYNAEIRKELLALGLLEWQVLRLIETESALQEKGNLSFIVRQAYDELTLLQKALTSLKSKTNSKKIFEMLKVELAKYRSGYSGNFPSSADGYVNLI